MKGAIRNLLLALALYAPTALANGRFPSADQLVINPVDSSHWVLRTTFGLLQSRDAGSSWRWICEAAAGFADAGDPALALLATGSVVTGYQDGIRSSRPDGCDWSPLSGDVQGQYFADATSEPDDQNAALFIVSRLWSDQEVRLFVVAGQPPVLSALNEPLGNDFSPLTLEVAPALPDRIYASGLGTKGEPMLLRTDDRGKHWERLPIEADQGAPYIAAIDPIDPDRLYVRFDRSERDSLQVSADGGRSFVEALSLQGDMRGFALSPDGSRVVVGAPRIGVFEADTASLTFSTLTRTLKGVSCLKWTEAFGLMACAAESLDGFTLGRWDEAAKAFAPLFHLQDLEPLACAADTNVGAICRGDWPAVAQTLGITPPSETAPSSADRGCSMPRAAAAGVPAGLMALLTVALLLRRRRGSDESVTR